MNFSKILIANRGEIACRILRTAHRLGYRSVAVYSDADAKAPHVRLADEAVRIGAPPAADSYLNIAALLAAARATGADAVHPGYGFLSERAEFAEACAAAGLVFIGPPPAAMRAMGDKAAAKRRMRQAGVPCVPGYLGEDQSDQQMTANARELGFPLLVKAVAGGGGRGMRLVRSEAELPEALAGARREAQSAFGSGTLMLERLIQNGRHIEVQVFCDSLGHAVHLGERDCTMQRRHQKVVEEAPSPVVGAEMREAMGRDALAAARAVGYVGAGTVEFIVDAGLNHFFLEMNTECITGLDLVAWQLRVARGEALPLKQEQISFTGHAVQARLYAEDPDDGFRPQTGRIVHWRPQATSVRVDHGIVEGDEVSPYYDAMLAKFVAHGHDRADALRRLLRALQDTPLLGVVNNASFLCRVLQHQDFVAARMTTTRLDEWATTGEAALTHPSPPEEAWQLAAALFVPPAVTRAGGLSRCDLGLHCQGARRVLRAPPECLVVHSRNGNVVHYTCGGVLRRATFSFDDATLHLALQGTHFVFTEDSPYPAGDAGTDAARARAPVAGLVARVAVAVGDVVVAGQPLVCVEAMKMELWLNAAVAGTVRAVHVQPRESVAAGTLLVELEVAS